MSTRERRNRKDRRAAAAASSRALAELLGRGAPYSRIRSTQTLEASGSAAAWWGDAMAKPPFSGGPLTSSDTGARASVSEPDPPVSDHCPAATCASCPDPEHCARLRVDVGLADG